MSRGMVAFLAGLGGGYLKAQDKAADEARQAKIDARDDIRFDREQKAYEDDQRLKSDLKDAAADRTVVDGTVIEGAGQRGLVIDPKEAEAIKQTLADEAELRGDAAPTSRAGQAVVGKMARGNEIATGPVDAASLNTPEARNRRVVDALQKNGQIERAATMENTLLDQQAKRLGLDAAQARFADEQFNRRLTERLSASPDWTQGAAAVLTETQVGSLAGATVTTRPTADGKQVEFVATKDGNQRVLGTFEQGEAGMAKFMQTVARVPLEAKIGWVVENQRAAQTQANADREFDLRRQGQENEQQYRQRVLGIQQAQEARAAATHRAAMDDANIPPGVKLQAATLAKQMETVNAALSKAMAEGLFDPNNEGTAQLVKQQRVLGLQYQRLMAPYIPGSENKADPLGMAGGGQPAAGGQGAPATAAPAEPAGPMVKATTAAQPPQDTLRGQVIGPLTPMSQIVASAQAGNPEAIAYLERRRQGQADTATAPRTSAEMLTAR